jgi:hypothetical protein
LTQGVALGWDNARLWRLDVGGSFFCGLRIEYVRDNDKGSSRFPTGMTERKTTATTLAASVAAGGWRLGSFVHGLDMHAGREVWLDAGGELMRMKRLVWGIALLLMVSAVGPEIAGAQGKTVGYDIAVHVSASEYLNLVNEQAQILTVTIGEKHYQLQGPTSSAKAFVHGNGLLNLGDYQAKLVVDTRKSAYESMQVYEFLLPDGSKRKFGVVGQSE